MLSGRCKCNGSSPECHETQQGEFHGTNTYAIVATEWMEHDPQASIAWLRGLPVGRDRAWALEPSTRRWLEVDLEAAEAWYCVRETGHRAAEATDIISGDMIHAYVRELLARRKCWLTSHRR